MKYSRAFWCGARVIHAARVRLEVDGKVCGFRQLFGEVAARLEIEEANGRFILSAQAHAISDQGRIARNAEQVDARRMIGAEVLWIDKDLVGAFEATAPADHIEVLIGGALGEKVIAVTFKRNG